MKEAVKIYIKGLQGGLADSAPDGDDTIEMIVEGFMYHQHGHTYIVYDDKSMDEGNVVKTTVKTYGNHVEIRRYGSIEHHMIFEEGKDHQSHYETPFGKLDIMVRTSRVAIEEVDYSMSLEIDYALDVNGTSIGDAYFSIRTERL